MNLSIVYTSGIVPIWLNTLGLYRKECKMSTYELACYLILGGLVFLVLLSLALYLVNKYRASHNKKKGD